MQIIKRNGDVVNLFAGVGGIAKTIKDIVDTIYEKFLGVLIKTCETVLNIRPEDLIITTAIHYQLDLRDNTDLKHIVIAFLEHSGLTRKFYLVTRFHRGNTDDRDLIYAM